MHGACHGVEPNLNCAHVGKPTPESRPRLLVTELWGLGDVALALPFLRTASSHADVTLVAKRHAAPLLQHFAPAVELFEFDAPWTQFSGKYRLHQWPWRELRRLRETLRSQLFDLGVSARPDPRDHALLTLAGARRRYGYARAGSGVLLQAALPTPRRVHRAHAWEGIATALGWTIEPPRVRVPNQVRRVVIHTGAARPVREWPRARFTELALRLRARGLDVLQLDGREGTVEHLISQLASADAFIGNDSGPGHVAAALGLPTFTVFGPQLPEAFAPVHPQAAWIEGSACPYKPCFDACRFPEPHCLLAIGTDDAWKRVTVWLDTLS